MTVKATCPVCGQQVALLSDGRIGRHGSATTCDGWGKLPKGTS